MEKSRMINPVLRRAGVILGMVAALLTTGIAGYTWLEGMTVLDAVYMTVITVSTVGFGEVVELGQAGTIFTIFIIIFGLGTFGYVITSISDFLLEGRWGRAIRRKQMESRLQNLENHFIVCGAGRTGQGVMGKLHSVNAPFVVVEIDEEKVENLQARGILCLCGDGSREETLQKAAIGRARGMATCLGNDADNVYVVLTARQLNPDLLIVSRAIDQESQSKLLKAGADRFVCPNAIGGGRMAYMLLRPAVVDFLDTYLRAGDVDLELNEIIIGEDSEILDRRLADTRLAHNPDLIVLAIQRGESPNLRFNPEPGEVLQRGDRLLVLGKPDQMGQVHRPDRGAGYNS